MSETPGMGRNEVGMDQPGLGEGRPGAGRSEGLGIARNTAFLGVGNVAALAIGFGTTILVTDQLGADRYGLLIGAQRFVGFFAVVANFGLHPLLVRAIAARTADVGALLGSVLALRAALSVCFGALVAIAAAATDYLPEHRLLLFAVAFVQLPLVFAEAFAAICEGSERMARVAWIMLARTLATFVGVCAAAWMDAGLWLFVAAYVVGAFADLAAAFLCSREFLVGQRIRARASQLAPLFREAIPYVMIGLGFAGMRGVDVMILTRFSSVPEVSRYGAALNFTDVLLMAPLVAQRALLPVLSRLHLTAKASDLASRSLTLFTAILIPACTGLALLAGSVMRLYPSGEYASAAPVLVALAGILVLLGASMVCSTFLTGAGRLGAIISAYAIALPVQIAATLLLVRDYGAVGAAVGSLIGFGVLTALLARASQLLGMRIAWRQMARQIAAAGVMVPVVLATRAWPLPVPVLAGVVAYSITLWLLMPANSAERLVVASLLGRWRGR